MEKKTNQAERARMGAIGESHVVAKLMEQGWDAFNANCTIKNFKTIDIVCIDVLAFQNVIFANQMSTDSR